MPKRFKIITKYQDGTTGVLSYDTYIEANQAYAEQLPLVNWYYDAESVRLIDTEQSKEGCEHVLHLCTTSKSF